MSFENRIAIVSRDFAFANNLKEFLQKEKLLNDVIVKGSFSDAFFESPTDLTILDYETFELEWHGQISFSNQFYHADTTSLSKLTPACHMRQYMSVHFLNFSNIAFARFSSPYTFQSPEYLKFAALLSINPFTSSGG